MIKENDDFRAVEAYAKARLPHYHYLAICVCVSADGSRVVQCTVTVYARQCTESIMVFSVAHDSQIVKRHRTIYSYEKK